MNRKNLKKLRNNASAAVSRAVKNGNLPRLDGIIKCKDCGIQASEYDHRNYTKPLEVEPVCGDCNKKRGKGFPFADLSKTKYGKHLEKIRKRNIRIVSDYFNGVSRVVLMKRHGISRRHFFYIISKHGKKI